MAAGIRVLIQYNSMQYSDPKAFMEADLHKIFAHAQKRADKVDGRLLGGGTEAGNNPLHLLIPQIAHEYGFWAFVSHPGEWVYVDRRFGDVADHGYIHVLPGHKSDSSHFGYNPRGITHLTIKPHDAKIAPKVTFGSSHLITGTSPASSHYAPFVKRANGILVHRIGSFAHEHGRGSNIALYGMDANIDDARRDVFMGAPMTTCWDALHKHPPTHGLHGSTIDIVAKYDGDGRVRFSKAVSLTDADLPLHTDHNTEDVDCLVKPLAS